jgi:hypothetical protein
MESVYHSWNALLQVRETGFLLLDKTFKDRFHGQYLPAGRGTNRLMVLVSPIAAAHDFVSLIFQIQNSNALESYHQR